MSLLLTVGVQSELEEVLLAESVEALRTTVAPDVGSALSAIAREDFDLIVIADSALLFHDDDRSAGQGFRLARLLARSAKKARLAVITERCEVSGFYTVRPDASVQEQAKEIRRLITPEKPGFNFSEIVVVDSEGDIVQSCNSHDPEMRVDLLDFLKMKGQALGEVLGESSSVQFLSHQNSRSIFCSIQEHAMAFGHTARERQSEVSSDTLSKFSAYINI